jgi:hypothetical protein
MASPTVVRRHIRISGFVQGPRGARVDSVEVAAEEPEGLAGFQNEG